MAAKTKTSDRFANIAWLQVTESAANTLTFATLNIANNLLDQKFALLLHRIDAFLYPTQLNSSGDYVTMALTVSDRLTSLSLSQPEVLAYLDLMRTDTGTAANASLLHNPQSLDLSMLPGGGILVPADRLYIGCQSVGAANPNTASCRIYYTVMPLETSDYWDLIEARRIMTT